MQPENSQMFKVYSVKSYQTAYDKFINENYKEYTLCELEQVLKQDDCYHMRVHNGQNYIFFGDLDGYRSSFDDFTQKLIYFMKEKYNIEIEKDDISYTKNKGKDGSYHYSIPKIYCSCEKLKEIQLKFTEEFLQEFKYEIDGTKVKCVDVSIFAEHWFRYPLQSKKMDKNTIHIIEKGTMRDFIVEYIPDNSENIETKQFINSNKKKELDIKASIKKTTDVNKKEVKSNSNKKATLDNISEKEINIDTNEKEINVNINANEKEINVNINEKEINVEKKIVPVIDNKNVMSAIDIALSKSIHKKKYMLYKEIFDKCFDSERWDDYLDWTAVGMALKNIYGFDAFELFNYFSQKSKKYEGRDITLSKFNSFKYNDKKCKNIGTLYKFAKKDNKPEYQKIMREKECTFNEVEFARKLFELAGDDFIYVRITDGNYKLYCYNGNYWVCDDLPMRQYITNELTAYYKKYITDVFWGSNEFTKLKKKIDDMATLKIKDNIIKLYKEFGIRDIEFDNKWWLFGFKNCVYDLLTHEFRSYQKTDYVSITTNYDWFEPANEEVKLINTIIDQIMPIKEERELYKTIMSTSLEGRCLEKFIVLNGFGRNGKGLFGDLLLKALGSYGFIANNSILFETNKTGSNPEKANMHKKRFIIFREPPVKNKFENSVIKELTGGGTFSARSHHEHSTEKMLHCTIICECNKRPLFAEEPTSAEVGRLIDIQFRATFTDDEDLLDQEYFHKAEKEYKTENFQDKHKRALLKILMESHKMYAGNGYNFVIPESTKSRTTEYLEMSCIIFQWFKENYCLSENKEDTVKIQDIFHNFKKSEYYDNLTKFEKRKYNYKYFIEYLSSNMTTKKYYKEKHVKTNERNILLSWTTIKEGIEKEEIEKEEELSNNEKVNSDNHLDDM